LHIPQPNPSTEEPLKPIMGQLAKEIQIKHKAPVIAISLFDAVRIVLYIHFLSSNDDVFFAA
jgi:hypothetical protein